MTARLPDPSVGALTDPRQRVADLEQENARRRQDRAEGAARESAMSEILRVIASSPTDLQAVLDAVAEQAARLCDPHDVVILRVDGDAIRPVAAYGGELRVTTPLDRGAVAGRAILDRETIHIHDMAAEPDDDFPITKAIAKEFGHRTILATPLVREGVGLGAILVRHVEVRPFTDEQIKLLETFADQAVIAIENARLFVELEQRTVELGQALDQQTALSEILRVIATSPTDLSSVLNTIAERAASVLGAVDAIIDLRDGDSYVIAGGWGPLYKRVGEHWPITNESIAGRVLLTADTVHIEDIAAVAEREFPDRAAEYLQAGGGTRLAVPLLREGMAIGVIVVRRSTVRLFSDEEIARLRAFADQAVIAIENARLFEELAELNRTLEARVSEQVEQLERIGRLRRYLSPQLADLIVSSGEESILESHRRLITVVFCDLRGFTAFAETAEPEEVTGVLDEFHAVVGELIREYEGTLDRFAGDGLMVFFNDPLPQPDHTERAVRMACAMRARTADLARGWRRAGYELDFGVGIAVGHATLGRIGFEGRYDYTAIGTVANLAARLCGEAAGGQILIPARLLGMIEALIETEPVGELALKGFHRSVSAFNITGLRDGESTEADGTT